MKKSTRILMATSFLFVFSLIAFFFIKSKHKTVNKEFQLSLGIEEIAEIEIIPKRGQLIKLYKEKGEWRLNQGELVRENAIHNLLEVFSEIQIKALPNPNAESNIRREMESIGIDVIVKDEDGRNLKRYTIGGVTQDERGTYVKTDASDRLFTADLATMEGGIRGRFLLPYLDWRDRTILVVDPKQVTQFIVEYPGQLSESFVIECKGRNDYILKTEKGSIGRLSDDFIQGYLRSITGLGAEAFENHNEVQDSIRSLSPFCTLKLVQESLPDQELYFWPVQRDIKQIKSPDGSEQIQRYFIKRDNGDFLLAQQRVIGPLFRGRSFFAEKVLK